MNKSSRLSCVALLLLAVSAMIGCPDSGNVTLTQFSTIDALMVGLYDGEFPIQHLKDAGNFGIGTFDHLDGEMLVLDGKVYQARSDGQVIEMPNDAKIPFATVTAFKPDVEAESTSLLDYAGIQKELDSKLPSPNLFYAVRLEGKFAHVKIRSVRRQEPPYRALQEAAKDQAVWEYDNVEGIVIGFKTPELAQRINVPGYHFHFMSKDRQKAGHVLDMSTESVSVAVDTLSTFKMALPNSGPFMDVDLTGDHSAALTVVESNPANKKK